MAVGFADRNFPVAGKTPEMVDANDVDQLENPAHPLDPPGIAFERMGAPAVQRVAPALAGGAEKIGPNAGDNAHPALFVQLEQLLARPDLGALAGNEDGGVADDFHTAFIGIGPQLFPLAEKTPLAEFPEGDAFGMGGARLLQGLRITPGQRRGPVAPVAAAVQRTAWSGLAMMHLRDYKTPFPLSFPPRWRYWWRYGVHGDVGVKRTPAG